MQNWLYGFALSFRINLLFALSTIISYIFFLKDKPAFRITLLFTLIIIFFIHSGLGVSLHGYYELQWDRYFDFSKAIVFFVFAVLLLRKKHHFESILAFLVLALCFHGIIEGLRVIVTFGGHTVSGINGPLGDNNKVALGLNMAIPLVLYLAEQTKTQLHKMILLGITLLCTIAVVGTNSRGGMIALGAMASYYWWKNDKKLLILIVVIFLVGVAYNFLPDKWFDRISALNDIEGSGVLDSRVTFWKINLLAALEFPFTGVGFDGTAGKVIWSNYTHALSSLNWGIETPIPKTGFVAHSIYFEVLGNQGIMGFVLFLGILTTCFASMTNLIKYYKFGCWQFSLVRACRISLATYCVAGLALNAAYFELVYLIFAIITCLLINQKIEEGELQVNTSNQGHDFSGIGARDKSGLLIK
jgi:probable O-glycosylation ligase (exosortase A-associated)